MLAHNLARVRQRIHDACQRSGRDPSAVTLVGVTKTVPLETIRAALALGLADVGENRVQDAKTKRLALGLEVSGKGEGGRGKFPSDLARVRWHLIGHLQRNKAKDAVELFNVIHSLDSLELAQALERHAGLRDKTLDILIQVNVSGEATKFGCRPEAAVDLAVGVMRLPHLRLAGLMTIAPFVDNPEHVRPIFRSLRMLRDDVQRSLSQSPSHPVTQSLVLSMGMSNDFEVAIEEGADVVRIGTAIFGSQGVGVQGVGE